MKSTKDFRTNHDSSDTLRRAAKLEPLRKSGKERHTIYRSVNGQDDDTDDELEYKTTKRESVYDYLDDGNEDPKEDL